MNRSKQILLMVGLITALLSTAALADQRVNETVKARADGLVTVENIAGSIEVVGWDREEVKVEGTLTGDAEEVVIDDGPKIRIKVKYPSHVKNLKGGADLVIHVPTASEVEVECVSAGVDVRDVTGSVEAESISGEVTVKGRCESVEAESISGDVEVTAEAREISLSSISGSITATGGTSRVEAETVSGRVKLSFDTLLKLAVESVSGDATITGDLDDDANVSIESLNGTVTLTVPANVNADFRIETFSGEIENEFGHKARRTSKYAPGSELEFSNGGGDAEVRIDTFNGDVIIRKD